MLSQVLLFLNPNQLFHRRGPKQRQTPASFLMTSAPPVTPAPVSQVEAADPGRSHPDPRSRPGVPRRRPTSPHPRLTSFSQASRSANPPSGWEHIPAITAGLAAPTHQPAKFSLARGVGFQRFPSPFPKPWNSWTPATAPGLPSRATVPGTTPIPPNLWLWIAPAAGGSPAPARPDGERQDWKHHPRVRRARDLQGSCVTKACLPVLRRTCGAHLRLILLVTQRRSVSARLCFQWVSKPQQPSHFESLIFPCFLGFLFSKEPLGTVRTASRALHFLLREGRSSLTKRPRSCLRDQGAERGLQK